MTKKEVTFGETLDGLSEEEMSLRLHEYCQKLYGGFTFTLPWPPSMNTYWRTFKGRMIISAKGRAYREAVIEQIKQQGGAYGYKGKLAVEIEAYRPDKRRRDLDNLLKAALDGCTHAGVWEDDSNIVDLRIYWADTIGGMIKVHVREL
jgi:crossover junction endodeoxyribonuclease RusA